LQHVQQSAEMTLPSEIAERKTLNLGSGRKYLADAFNVDHQASTNPELVHDLNSNHDASFFIRELFHRSYASPSLQLLQF
jgi:hypothetical protein